MYFNFCICFFDWYSYSNYDQISATGEGVEQYKSIIKKKKKKHDKILFLAKSKLNKIEVLISKALIDLVIGHDEYVLKKNVLEEYKEMKEEIKNLKI